MNNIHAMKALATLLLVAAFLVTALIASGYSPDAADFVSIFFAAGLSGWTLQEYSRKPRPLTAVSRPITLPVSRHAPSLAPASAHRVAA
ncbi:MAG: hypothetical protein PHQ04_06220 [Opitutaceae bacterium]|nr:hypothetical protein [Opitutaceae bacterium]